MQLKVRYFDNASEVTKFCNTVANGVTTVVSITYSTASAKFVLFYN